MTRWDCDVRLWRGVPCSFPAFHGWPVSTFDIVQSSTASTRYVSCGECSTYCRSSSRCHTCFGTPPPKPEQCDAHLTRDIGQTDTADVTGSVDSDNATASGISDDDDDDDDRQPVFFVVSTGDNGHIYTCYICHDRMRLDFLPDAEEWVFMDCVEHEGVPVHKDCYDCVSYCSRSSELPIL